MKPLLVSSGEPAGIGPDVCLALAGSDIPLVIIGDRELLENRASNLNLQINFKTYQSDQLIETGSGILTVLHRSCTVKATAGQLNAKNASYVVDILTEAVERCMNQEFSGLVTAPVHKGIINKAGFPFTGHTELLAQLCRSDRVVMLLACEKMKVALVTTHLPLSNVAEAMNKERIIKIIETLDSSLRKDFNISQPKIKVAGLNPHAGESGYLGREEIDIIAPALNHLRENNINIEGPLPADTMFAQHHTHPCDAYVAMYHDQGLPVLKYAGFGKAVNITLGLPIIRTSVDHGTALELAGTGKADTGSMIEAVNTAQQMALNREKKWL